LGYGGAEQEDVLVTELILSMLMNFSFLFIAFCDIKAILPGSTITPKELRYF